MKEYVKSETEPDVYGLLKRETFSNGGVLLTIIETRTGEPSDGIVVGTYATYESGYDPIQGIVYDETVFDFYET